jgi:hypothetical protein
LANIDGDKGKVENAVAAVGAGAVTVIGKGGVEVGAVYHAQSLPNGDCALAVEWSM